MDEKQKVVIRQKLHEILQSGLEKIKPKVAEMSNLIMDAYQQGFNDCWELFTGEKRSDYDYKK